MHSSIMQFLKLHSVAKLIISAKNIRHLPSWKLIIYPVAEIMKFSDSEIDQFGIWIAQLLMDRRRAKFMKCESINMQHDVAPDLYLNRSVIYIKRLSSIKVWR